MNRRVFVALVAVVVIAILANHIAVRSVMNVHPIGSTPAPYGYVEYMPPLPGPRPLLIVLHGSGGCGDGSDPGALIDRLPPLRDTARARLFGRSSVLTDEGVLIAAPQSPAQWDPAKLDRFLDHLLATREIDRDRIYLTGPSMGGCGSWRYAAAHPDRLAAVLAICSGCPPTGELAAEFRALPVHAVHAFDDEIVPYQTTADWMRTAATQRGGNGEDPMREYPRGTDATLVFDGAKLTWRPGTHVSADEKLSMTELARGGHRIWIDVYAGDAEWRWLFTQRRGR